MLSAQVPIKKSTMLTERQIIISQIEKKVEASEVLDYLQKCAFKIARDKSSEKPLVPIDYFSYSSRIELWIKYRWFIADTELSKKWLKKVHELMLYMTKTKRYIKSAKFSGSTKNEKYPQMVKYFDVAYKRFVKLVKKPVKVSGKVERRAKVKKVLWQKAMRKKYKIKGKIQEEF